MFTHQNHPAPLFLADLRSATGLLPAPASAPGPFLVLAVRTDRDDSHSPTDGRGGRGERYGGVVSRSCPCGGGGGDIVRRIRGSAAAAATVISRTRPIAAPASSPLSSLSSVQTAVCPFILAIVVIAVDFFASDPSGFARFARFYSERDDDDDDDDILSGPRSSVIRKTVRARVHSVCRRRRRVPVCATAVMS